MGSHFGTLLAFHPRRMQYRKNWIHRRIERIEGRALALRVGVFGARALFRSRTRRVIMPGIQVSIGAVSAVQLAVAALPAMQLATAFAVWWSRMLVPSPELRADESCAQLRDAVRRIGAS